MPSVRDQQDDRGAAAVEFALLFPIFMILALGTIAGGTAFSKQISVTQTAREASRFGSTLDIRSPGAGDINAWLTDVADAAEAAAGPERNPFGGYDYLCVAYIDTNAAGSPEVGTDSAPKSKYLVRRGPAAENPGVWTHGAKCPRSQAPVIPDARLVQVVVTRASSFFVIFINPTLQLDANSVTPYEGSAP